MGFNIKGLIGQFQKNLIVFGINKKYITSMVTLITGLVTIPISEFIMPIGDKSNFKYSLIIGLASVGLTIYTFIDETMELINKQNQYLDVTPFNFRNEIFSKVYLSKNLKDSGYDLYAYKGEHYIMSLDVNRLLLEKSPSIDLKMDGSFTLAREVESIVPLAVKKAFEKKSFLFNGKLIRMIDDFTLEGLEETRCIRIQKTTYFHTLCTNEVVYRRIKDISTMDQDNIFEGYKLLYDKTKEGGYSIINLKDNYCANHLGGSTLAITNDNYIVLTKNPGKSDINSDKMVPSGSGSTDFKDYVSGDTYGSLVTRTLERELREECNIKLNTEMNTMVIGYARLLNRGGKPDFFGITYLNCSKKEISASRKEIREMGEYCHEFIKFDSTADIVNVLGQYIEDNYDGISLQLKIMHQILEDFIKRGIDVWSKVMEDTVGTSLPFAKKYTSRSKT